MSYFSHLECCVPCGAAPLRSAQANSISARAALPCSRATISRRARAWSRESLAGRERDHVAVSRADAALRRRGAAHARRRLDAAHPRDAARRASSASSGCSSRTSRSTRRTLSRRAACPRPSRARRHLGARVAVGAVRGQRRQRDGRLRGGRRPRGEGLHAERREGAVHPRVRAVRRRGEPRRRPDHRRRPHRGGERASRSAGTTCPR